MKLLAFLILGALAYWIALVLWTICQLTHPPRRTFAVALSQGRAPDPSKLDPRPGSTTPREFTSYTITADNHELPVWDMPGDNPAGPTLILTHGWGDSRIGALSRANALLPFVSRCVMWDMPGQGDAPGVCTLGLREVSALRALIQHVHTDPPSRLNAPQPSQNAEAPTTSPHRIVLFGWSMGAGVSLAAAASLVSQQTDTVQIAGVIAESPYRAPITPARAVFTLQGLPHKLTLHPALTLIGLWQGVGASFPIGASQATRDPSLTKLLPTFDRAVIAQTLKTQAIPLLIIHGTLDSTCPIQDAHAIAREAATTVQHIDGAGHFGLWTDPKFKDICTQIVSGWLNDR